MSAISSKAMLKTGNSYKYNACSELEEELNYYNTFFRKYCAQIGRFTGVDILSEEAAELNPYNFGGNNPIMFSDPSGAQMAYRDGEGNQWHHADGLAGTLGAGIPYLPGYGLDGFGDMGGGGAGGNGGGGDYSKFWNQILNVAKNAPNGTNITMNSSQFGMNSNQYGTWYKWSYSTENNSGDKGTNGEVILGRTFIFILH